MRGTAELEGTFYRDKEMAPPDSSGTKYFVASADKLSGVNMTATGGIAPSAAMGVTFSKDGDQQFENSPIGRNSSQEDAHDISNTVLPPVNLRDTRHEYARHLDKSKDTQLLTLEGESERIIGGA